MPPSSCGGSRRRPCARTASTRSPRAEPTGCSSAHAPVGIALLITPWNFPAAMATRKLGPALAAGCTVVLKPAQETPLTALAIARLLEEAGVPQGVVNVVCTDEPARARRGRPERPARAQAVVHGLHRGRPPPARAVRAAGDQRVDGARRQLAVPGPGRRGPRRRRSQGAMAAKMRNGGEACTAANRFLVHESVAEDFTSGLTEAMAAVRVGNGFSDGAQLGPLINAAAREKIERLVADARRPRRTRAHRRRAPARARVLLSADGARQRPAGERDARRGGLRPGGARS